MNAKAWPLLFSVVFLATVAVRAQESVRDLSGAGQHGKFLTPGQLDRWVFDGEKGETIIARVVSTEFDPTLELAKADGKDDKVLLEVDDKGNESRFSIRLSEKGQYKIRIHAFKYQGGGNYTLQVRRFQAQELAVGKRAVAAFDHEGKSYHYFPAVKDQILIPQLKGVSSKAWKMLDVKGREMTDWAGAVSIEESGECYLVVSGQPNYRYDLLVREAQPHDLALGKGPAGKLAEGELDVWSFAGKPGEFRLLEVEKEGLLAARLIYAPLDKQNEERIARPGARPEIEFLPVASRGGRLRFAAILGREGRYQLQLLAETSASYKLVARDPSQAIQWEREAEGGLPVGGAAFYSFKAVPGQLLEASLVSERFVPALRLYDAQGSLVTSSGEGPDALEGRLTHMVVSEGLYRLQVSSLGDGGGGDFRLTLKETKVKELQVDGRGQGTLRPGATDFWAFTGKAGQTVFLSVRSAAFEPAVSLRSPDGVGLAADSQGSAETGSLVALKLPKTGKYTVWIASRRGAGDYVVRLIDGD